MIQLAGFGAQQAYYSQWNSWLCRGHNGKEPGRPIICKALLYGNQWGSVLL